MKNLKKSLHLLLWSVAGIVLFAYLQTYCKYHFYFVEQNQLFQNTFQYWMEHLAHPGGFAETLSGFLVQFFVVHYAGAIVTAILLVSAGWLTSRILRRIDPAINLDILCLFVTVTLLFIHFSFNYMLYGTIAYLMALGFLYIAVGINSYSRRLIFHHTAVLLLFILAGPVSLLYAVVACVYETVFHSGIRSLYSFLIILFAVLISLLSVHFTFSNDFRFALLPDEYYHRLLKPQDVIYFSWIVLPVIFLAARYLHRKKSGKMQKIASSILQIALVIILCVYGIPRYKDTPATYIIKQFDYYSRTSQWDKILEHSKGEMTNYVQLNYVNMALNEKGEIGNRMFAFDQRGEQGLVIEWNPTAAISTLLSDVYFAMNDIAASQEMAFKAYQCAMYSENPRNLMRLIETNIIYGEYDIAERYICELEKTLFYGKWAAFRRRFLYNDAEVEADYLLGFKRSCLPKKNFLANIDGIEVDLQRIAEHNPAARSSIESAGCYYLLTKDIPHFKQMLETYFNTIVLPSLPIHFQEAVIIAFENQPEMWVHYRITQYVVDRMMAWRNSMDTYRNNPNLLPGMMKQSFGDTYWYYYMFK